MDKPASKFQLDTRTFETDDSLVTATDTSMTISEETVGRVESMNQNFVAPTLKPPSHNQFKPQLSNRWTSKKGDFYHLSHILDPAQEEPSVGDVSLEQMGYKHNNIPNWHCISQPPKTSLYTLLRNMIETFVKPNVEIRIGSAGIKCHMMVLQAYSEFFMDFNTEEVVKLPEDQVSMHAFAMAYDWMISDVPFIPREGIVELFQAAKFLKISGLISHCWTIFADRQVIHEENAFLLYLEAHHYHNEELEWPLLERITKFFLPLVSSREFLLLTGSELAKLLTSDSLGVNSEIEVFLAAVHWFNNDWEGRKGHVLEVMKSVRFGLIPGYFLVQIQRDVQWHEIHRITSQSNVAKLIEDGLAYSAYVQTACTSTEDFQQFLQRYNIKKVEQRYWLYDSKCRYHHGPHCPKWKVVTYLSFLEYLSQVQKLGKEHWSNVQMIGESLMYEKPCCVEARKRRKKLDEAKLQINYKHQNDRIKGGEEYGRSYGNDPQQHVKMLREETTQKKDRETIEYPKVLKCSRTIPVRIVNLRLSARKHASPSKKNGVSRENYNKDEVPFGHGRSKEQQRRQQYRLNQDLESATRQQSISQQAAADAHVTENTQVVNKALESGFQPVDVTTKENRLHISQNAMRRVPDLPTKYTFRLDGGMDNKTSLHPEVSKLQNNAVRQYADQATSSHLLQHRAGDSTARSMVLSMKLAEFEQLPSPKILLFGGYDPFKKPIKSFDNESVLSIADNYENVLCYDSTTDTWRSVDHIPFGSRQNHVSACCNGKIYLIGGSRDERGNSNQRPFLEKSVWVFDPKTMKWDFETSLPESRQNFAVIAVEDKCDHCKGGRKGNPVKGLFIIGGEGANCTPLSTVWFYNVESKQWTERAPLNKGRFGHSAVLIQDKIWVSGGMIDGNYGILLTDTMECYSLTCSTCFRTHTGEGEKWTIASESLRFPRLYAKMTQMPNGDIFLTGGMGYKRDCRAVSFAEIDFWDTQDREWKHCGDLQVARHSHEVVAQDDHITVIGGVSITQQKTLSQIERFNVKTKKCVEKGHLPYAVSGASAVLWY